MEGFRIIFIIELASYSLLTTFAIINIFEMHYQLASSYGLSPIHFNGIKKLIQRNS